MMRKKIGRCAVVAARRNERVEQRIYQQHGYEGVLYYRFCVQRIRREIAEQRKAS